MEILVESEYLDHQGGTKFYEVVQLLNVEKKSFVVINRWGKIAERAGGGQVKIEKYRDARQCHEAARKKLDSKRHREYFNSVLKHGLHDCQKVDSDTLPLWLGEHYRDTDNIDRILGELGVANVVGQILDEVNDIIVEEPAPEIIRGDDWGSW